MSSIETKPAFLERFDSVWTKMRRTQIGQAVCWASLVAMAGFAALTTADYFFEVEMNDRAIGLGVVAAFSLTIAMTWIIRAIRRWSRPKAATEIEARFPELGQAVRTSVEFGSQSAESLGAEGVQPSLVSALATDTEQRAAPLHIDSIVPVRRLKLAAALTVAVAFLLLAGVALNWEWRIASLRTLLGDQAYTELTVSPGNLTLMEGESVGLAIAVSGRTNRNVVVATRPVGSDGAWVERELTEDDAVSTETRLVRYETTVAGVVDPLEYRVTAGPAESDLFRINVRHPLAIESIRADITPPEYTGVEPSTVEEGNLNVIDGSTVDLNITLDRKPATATLVMTERGGPLGPGEVPKVQEIPLAINDATLSTSLELRKDQTYAIYAVAEDGMELAENKFRVRVRYDQPPEIWFEEPDEALEVHSIAEVLMRIRARDDFGLTRASIVFEVNNEEEYTLLEKDYAEIAAALAAEGQPSQQTRDALQRLLPLELFNLEEKDSVTYYGVAEDNYPDAAHRTETDLRFIDIRPFRRVYRLPDPNAPAGANNTNFPQVRTLKEIIARQRFNLNRTIRTNRKVESGSEPTLVEVDRIAAFEDDLSKSTHELAEFLDEREFDGSDLLFQAENVMLTAVDSLNVSKFELSSEQQMDALRLLIEGRNSIEIFLRTRANAGQRNALRSFDRMQIQRLRRPKRDKEDEEDPEQLVARIRRLADEEEIVYKTLTNLTGGRQPNAQPNDSKNTSGQSNNPMAKGREGGQGGGKQKENDKQKDDGDEGKKKGDEGANDSGKNEPGENEPGEEGQQKPSEEEGDSNADETDGNDSDERDMDSDEPSGMSREEAEQRQQDIALEARDIESILNRMQNMSELARSRGTEVADTADAVSEALSRGSTDEATEAARDTGEMLRQLAVNVEGVTAREASQKIGMARDLAGMVAAMQRRLANEADPDAVKEGGGDTAKQDEERPEDQVGGGSGEKAEELTEEQRAALAGRAARLAETGKTMKDILESAIETNSPGDREAVRRVDEVLAEGEVEETVERMEDVARMLQDKRDRDAGLEGQDVADKLDVLARQLDQVYRSIVTPRVEQLMALEARAAEGEKKLRKMETNEQISQWHREALELMEDLDEAQAARNSLDNLYEVMQAEGWSKKTDRTRWNWNRNEKGQFIAPESYGPAMRQIIEELQMQMQELILTDLVADDNEATPPKYKHLVDVYYEVLSSDTRGKQ